MSTEKLTSTAVDSTAKPAASGIAAATGQNPAAVETSADSTVNAQLINHAAPKPLVTPTKHTPGESLYKWTVHGGINFLLNESIGMYWMWAGQFGENSRLPGAKSIYKMTNKFTPKVAEFFEKKLNRTPATAHLIADQVIDIGLLTMGGNILVFPIKMIEDHKQYWVKKADAFLDRLHGHAGDISPQMQADREAAYERIAQEEKPTWGRVAVARISSILFNTATLTMWKVNDKNPDVNRRGTGRISNKIADFLTGERAPANHVATHADFRWWTNTAILETISTMVTASIFYVKYEIFDRKKEKKAAAEKANAAQAAESATAGSSANDVSTTVSKELAAEAVHQSSPERAGTIADVVIPTPSTTQELVAQALQNASPERAATALDATQPSKEATQELVAQALQNSSPERPATAEEHQPLSHAARIDAQRHGQHHQAQHAPAHQNHASRGDNHAAAIREDKRAAEERAASGMALGQ